MGWNTVVIPQAPTPGADVIAAGNVVVRTEVEGTTDSTPMGTELEANPVRVTVVYRVDELTSVRVRVSVQVVIGLPVGAAVCAGPAGPEVTP